MRKTIKLLSLSAVAALLLGACQGPSAGSHARQGGAGHDAPTEERADETASDQTAGEAADAPMPRAADELFDDFFFNFSGNGALQRQRIRFPLAVTDGDGNEFRLDRKDWTVDPFFTEQGYYTLILDRPEQAEAASDTAVTHAIVERINLDDHFVSQYVFDRQQGHWFLTAIHHEPLEANHNGSFLAFYQRFATDSLFQRESLSPHMEFTTTDPDDDFATITGTMEAPQWDAFRPAVIPTGTIYNIVYGAVQSEGLQKYFVIHGIANEIETQMTFRKKNGRWRLTDFEF